MNEQSLSEGTSNGTLPAVFASVDRPRMWRPTDQMPRASVFVFPVQLTPHLMAHQFERFVVQGPTGATGKAVGVRHDEAGIFVRLQSTMRA